MTDSNEAGDREHDLDEDVGRATIVYDDPDEGTVEKTVPNEHIVYFQDHWTVKIAEEEDGRDRIRRIPSTRVHYVERTVEEFADEIGTITSRAESVVSDLRGHLPGGDSTDSEPGPDADPGSGSNSEDSDDVVHIDVTDRDDDDDRP
jgi:hypothetical protein